MDDLKKYNLTLVIIDEKYHLFDLISNEIYEAMSLVYLTKLIELWNNNSYYIKYYGIIKLVI